MTGFGEAHSQRATTAVAAEVRTINSRYFKLVIRSTEGYSALEPQIEALVREQIKRGTVQVNLRVDRARSPDDFRLNATVLAAYRQQLEELRSQWRVAEPVSLESLIMLPGVVEQSPLKVTDVEADWPLIQEALRQALENLASMRLEEGRAMAVDLAENGKAIARELDAVEKRAPTVSDAYRERLSDRLAKALSEFEITLQAGDLVREVSIYAERSDVSEETVRLRSHLDQFAATLALDESAGRKLEFLTQEMFREANTIGSKANDVEISRHVIEIKAAIERIREMIQNVE
jgi:uncharacterized protein (TIGR00255 family)